MAYNEGTGNFLAYNREATWGTPPSTAYPKVRKLASSAITTERSSIQTQEMNSRRAVTGLRLGTRKSRVSVSMELFYSGDQYSAAWAAYTTASPAQFDDFMQSWMCAAETVAGSDLPAIDFMALARGQGCDAVRVEHAEALRTTLAKALHSSVPILVEVEVA